MTDDRKADTFYAGVANLEAMASATRYTAWLVSLVRSKLQLTSGDMVLDFGAGTGTFCKALSSPEYRLVCLEPDPFLRASLGEEGFVTCNRLDSAGERYTKIYLLNVLEHIEDDVAALRDIKASAAPGARILIFVPAFSILYSSMDAAVGHFRRYTARSLSSVAESAGLTVDECRYADSIGFFAALWLKIFGAKTGELSPKLVHLYDKLFFPVSLLLDRVFCRMFGKNVILVARA